MEGGTVDLNTSFNHGSAHLDGKAASLPSATNGKNGQQPEPPSSYYQKRRSIESALSSFRNLAKKIFKNYNILFLTWYFNTNLFTFSKSIFRLTLFCWFTVERRRGSWRNDLVWQASGYRKRFRFRFSHYLRKTRFQPSNLFQKEQGKYLFFYSSDIFKFSENA